MSYQSIPLLAGLPHRLDIAGRLILLDSPGVAGGIDIALVNNGTPRTPMKDRQQGFRHIGEYEGVILTAAVDTTAVLFLSFEDVDLGTNQLQITNPPSNPVYVSFTQAIVPLGSVTINNTNAQAAYVQQQALAVIVDHAAAVINTGAVQLLISDATFKRLRVRNASASARVALGGAAVTMANAAIVLEPGESWIEDDAAGADWYAVSDINGADVRVMGVK